MKYEPRNVSVLVSDMLMKKRRAHYTKEKGRAKEAPTNITYFIQCVSGGPIKIGRTEDLETRLAGLQVSNHEELVVLCSVKSHKDLEPELHALLDKYRVRGEWFEPSKDVLEVMSLIKTGDHVEVSKRINKLNLGTRKYDDRRFPFDSGSSLVL